jgi:hypothetical protein
MRKKRNAFRVLVVESEGKRALEDLGLSGRTILKGAIKKVEGRV